MAFGRFMKNIGPKSSKWLASIGIRTLDDVAKIGVVETYKRVKAAYPDKVTLNMLWGLQAALLDIPWNELPSDIKEELKRQIGEP
jgi:DNA transformation protein